jgi:hypothetical protein
LAHKPALTLGAVEMPPHKNKQQKQEQEQEQEQ